MIKKYYEKMPKLTNKELQKLVKIFSPKEVIDKWTNMKLFLTSDQLDKLIELKNEVK